MHGKCCGHKWVAIVVLVVGILFLLRDLNVWNFFNIQWFTVLFVLFGLMGLIHPMKK
jgi:hypothetical protein